MKSTFGYPGGKSYLAKWIVSYFPQHKCYVEPFGGAAAVLVEKAESEVEVYNDKDGDLVQFFTTLRDHDEQLRQWLRNTPYSRDLHRKYAREFYNGYRPEDRIERAGRFFYLRYSQFAGKYTGVSGFSSAQKRNPSKKYHNGVGELEGFAERLRNVQIENRDYSDIFDRFDAADTLFYLDPPYVDEGDELYSHETFDHDRFVSELGDLEGMWLVSYTDLPDGLREQAVSIIERDTAQKMRQGQPDRKSKRRTERLACNFDPSEVPSFAGAEQSTLTEVA